MPLSKIITHFIRNGEETREEHRDPALRTHHYRKSKQDMMSTIQHLLKHKLPSWHVVHVQEEHGEISVEKRSALGTSDIIITVFSESPIRCAVDVASSRRGNLGDFGTSYNNIVTFFRGLNHEVTPEA